MSIIDRLEQTPERVRALIEGRSDEDLSFKPAPDAFSLRENVLHLRDIDVDGYEVRIAGLLAERGPHEFPDIDGAALARERNYNGQPVAPALEDFASSRARSIARLRESTDRKRYGRVGTRAVSLEGLLEDWARHDSEHLAEMTHHPCSGNTRSISYTAGWTLASRSTRSLKRCATVPLRPPD